MPSNAAPAAPVQTSKAVSNWLFGMTGLVATMVLVGGYTRLTRSGLSMTDWKLQGSMFPITAEEWEKEFERYKTFPEWQQRQSMTVDEFKFIYFWEYSHRMLGRLTGIAFALPAAYFGARGMIPRHLYPRLGLLFGLGGTQGLIGWWMVKSGLEMDPQQKREIRVSPYRLVTHFTMAIVTGSLLFWTALDARDGMEGFKRVAKGLTTETMAHARKIRKYAHVAAMFAGVTAVSGAFVAGNDAGRAYNRFPLMTEDSILPPLEEVFPNQVQWWRNFFESTALVQFDHRVLAVSTLTSIITMFGLAFRRIHLTKQLPTIASQSIANVTLAGSTQVLLGITALLNHVPINVASMHQAGALYLLGSLIFEMHQFKFTKLEAGITSEDKLSAIPSTKFSVHEASAAAVAARAEMVKKHAGIMDYAPLKFGDPLKTAVPFPYRSNFFPADLRQAVPVPTASPFTRHRLEQFAADPVSGELRVVRYVPSEGAAPVADIPK